MGLSKVAYRNFGGTSMESIVSHKGLIIVTDPGIYQVTVDFANKNNRDLGNFFKTPTWIIHFALCDGHSLPKSFRPSYSFGPFSLFFWSWLRFRKVKKLLFWPKMDVIMQKRRHFQHILQIQRSQSILWWIWMSLILSGNFQLTSLNERIDSIFEIFESVKMTSGAVNSDALSNYLTVHKLQ